MADNKKTPLWLDRHQILDPAHADWLETQAAISEFGNGMPREEAEAKAYADYKRKHSAQAAAHHLAGMRAASGEEAKQHGAMYALHCKQLGCDPSGPVPDEVKAFLNSDDFKHPVKFSAHKADSFVLDTPKPVEQMGKNELDPEYMATLYRAAKLATILGELNKGWPKNDKENRENLEANAAFSDMAEEQGVPAPALQPRPGVDLRPALRFEEQLQDILNDESSGEWQWDSTSPSYDPSSVYGVSPVMTKKLSRHGWNIRATGPAGEVVGGRYTPKDPRGTWRIHVKPDEDTPPNEEPPDLRDMIRPPFNIKAVSEHHVKAIADALQQHLDAGRPIREFDPSATKPPRTYHPSAYEKKFGFRRPLPKKSTIPTGLAKALVPPVAQAPALHSTVEGFAGGLKALPKGSPERLRFITKHMSHAPFLRALQAHPQGKALHGQLMGILNSHANAGLRPGATVATAKNELAKGDVIKFPGNPTPKHKYRANAEVAPIDTDANSVWEDGENEGKLVDKQAFARASAGQVPEFEEPKAIVRGIGGANNVYDYSHFLPEIYRNNGATLSIMHSPGQHDDYMTVELKNNLGQVTNPSNRTFAYPTTMTHVQPGANEGQQAIARAIQNHQNWIKFGKVNKAEAAKLAKGEVANNPSFFLDEEHQLPTHLETEGYRLHLSHNGADVHMGTVHRGGNVVGRVELVPGGFREEWNNPRHGLDSAVKMVLSAHANRQPVVDGWNNAMFSAGVPVAKMAKAAPGFTGKVQGAEVTSPHSTYAEASAAKPKNMSAHGNKNLWVRQSSDGNNSNRTLMVQFSSDLLQGNRQRDHSDDYYDKLYKNREGYHRPDDFWELPQWQAHLANSMPNADHYTIRDPKEAVAFANAAGYKNVAFSALDVNRDFVKEFAQGYKGNVVVGGYTDMSHFAGLPNVKVHNTIQDFVESEGGQYNPGYDYRHFSGTKTIPRLTLSDGCAHKCAFCCVPKQVTEKTRDEIMQQVDSFSKHLPSDLIYLNDKTFGQAPNHAMLPEIYQRIKAANPNFKGFIVQTTAAQLKKMDPEFLRKAGIRHVEIGVESYNDSILRAHKKPANEQLIDESAQKLRNAGIGLIPNIMVGLPGEDQNTYKRTMDWLNRNSDIVSHVNAYNLALYDESELGKKIGALSNADKDENQITKSFHVNPQVHKDFANELFAYASRQLDKHPNVVIKAEGAKPKVKAKAWKSKDGITIPCHGTPERAEWDKRFRQALIENFAGGNAARLKPVKVDPNLATTTNMPVNKARLELYKQMAKKDKLPPIIVRKAGRGYVVIDGNHRFAAAVDAKLPHVDGYELVMPK